jgi:hypothetical protein
MKIGMILTAALITATEVSTIAAAPPPAVSILPAICDPTACVDARQTHSGNSYLVAQQTSSRVKVALLIGNASYPDANQPLIEPVNDARALADELKRDGFDVTVTQDLTKQEMRSALDSFKAKIRGGSAALLFFSGYGIQTGKQSYLIPIDAQIWTEGEVKRDGISIESILHELDGAGASVKVIVIDAARRNPFERRFRGYSAGLASLSGPAGTLAIFSAAPNKVAGETSDSGSLLVTELLKGMRTSRLTAEDVFNRTRADVSRASNNEQVPWVSSSLTENFYFGGEPGESRPSPFEQRPSPQPEPRTSQSGPSSSASNEPRPSTSSERPKSQPPASPAKTAPAPGVPAATAAEFNKRGLKYARNKDYPNADADFSEAIRRNSKYAEAFNNRCWTRVVMGQAREALADCDQAIQLRVDYADAFDSRGLVYLKLGNFEHAIADFDTALRLSPKKASSLYGRGMAKLKKRLISEGTADIAAAKAIDPNIGQEYAHYGVE